MADGIDARDPEQFGLGVMGFGLGLVLDRSGRTKGGGAFTEPRLPGKTVAESGGVRLEHYTRSGDHGPAHLHVKGGGPETRIGQHGKPLKNSPEVSPQQRELVEANKSVIRKAIDSIQRWFRFENR
jgi:hypothetical protein